MSFFEPDLLACALGALVLLSALRLLLRRPSRWPLRMLLSGVAALALYWLLQPPAQPLPRAGALTVLVEGWRAAPAELGPLAAVVALPEAGADLPAGVARVPDLASALRARPQFEGLRLLGRGLPARDHEVARGRLLEFVSAPALPGLQALQVDAQPALGDDIVVQGGWQGPAPARLQLLDSEGAVLAEQVMGEVAAAAAEAGRVAAANTSIPGSAEASDPTAAGDSAQGGRPDVATEKFDPASHGDSATPFVLRTPARAVGVVTLTLAAVDSAGAARPLLQLPISVRAPPRLRLQLRAGAPSPELKSLRRWAVDAGLALDSRIQFAPGLVQSGLVQGTVSAQASGAAAADTNTVSASDFELPKLDLLIIDERAWAAQGPGGRAEILAAVDAGLGLLLRLSAVPGPAQRSELAELGFAITPREAVPPLRLAGSTLRLRRLPIEVEAGAAVSLPSATEAVPAGLWQARGQGRVAVMWLLDSFRLVGAGEAEHYAALWSQITGTLARAPSQEHTDSSASMPMLQAELPRAWRGERWRLCGHSGELVLSLPAGERSALARADARGCRALWPRESGLHWIETAASARTPLQVLEPSALPALHAADLADATHLLRAQALRHPAAEQALSAAPGKPWIWLVLLLGVLALLWWLERPRPVA